MHDRHALALPLVAPVAALTATVTVARTVALVFALTVALAPVPARAAACAPEARAPQGCLGGAALGPLSRVAAGGVSRAAGNPVDLVSGARTLAVVDLAEPPPALAVLADAVPLAFVRHYDSRRRHAGVLGPGWSHGFETRLAHGLRHGLPAWQIVQADGRRIDFDARDATRQQWQARDPADGLLRIDADGAWWHWPEGRRWRFDAHGHPVELRAPGRIVWHLRWHLDEAAGERRLQEVHTSEGRRLRFVHAAGRLVRVEDERGVGVRLHFDAAGRLETVVDDDGTTIRHGYDDPRAAHRLTRVVEADGRASEHAFDALGRVVRARAADASHEQALAFDYAEGVTTVRQGARVARYRYAAVGGGVPRLVSGHGQACEHCPPTGWHWRHDARGRLLAAERPDEPGRPAIRWSHDETGAVVAMTRTAFGVTAPAWRVHRLRGIGDGAHLVEIVSPSVVTGRLRRLRLAFDAEGRLVEGRLQGFEPLHGRALERVVRIGYGTRHPARPVSVTTGDGEAATLRHWRRDVGGALVAIEAEGIVLPVDDPQAGPMRREPPPVAAFDPSVAPRPPAGAGGATVGGVRIDAPGWRVFVDVDGRRTVQRVDDLGRLVAEQGDARPARRIEWDVDGRPVEIADDSGALERYAWDALGRLQRRVRIETRAVSPRVTDLGWQGAAIVRVDDPHEGWRLIADAPGAWRLWRVRAGPAGALVLAEAGASAADGSRTVVRPDGLALRESRDAAGRLMRLEMRLPGETRWRPVAQRDAQGLRLGHGARAVPGFDGHGRLTALRWQPPPASGARDATPPPWPAWTLHRDHAGRVQVVAAHDGTRWLRRDAAAQVVAERIVAPDGGDVLERRWPPVPAGEATGRTPAPEPPPEGRRDPFGRLITGHGTIAGALHDGHRRVAELDARGRIVRHVLWWDDVPVAFVDLRAPRAPSRGRGAAWQPRRAVAAIVWLHIDPRGLPVAASRDDGRIVWRGRFDAYGGLVEETGALRQPLRLAGQVADPRTGEHDAGLRRFDPRLGRFTTADPLGLAAGLDPTRYAGGDPWAAIDPTGLLLVAFDGTDNASPAPRRDTVTNVVRFAEAYRGGPAWYMPGVAQPTAPGAGVPVHDALSAATARSRVDAMLGRLDVHLRSLPAEAPAVEIDLVGFSRGAAMARDFANRVVAGSRPGGRFDVAGVCVRLRFMGLWDTVAQFGAGLANADWQLSVPPEVHSVVHAVALHEHRWLFPAESIAGSPGPRRVEFGFVGAHSDVGGGYPEGDLADVSLNWVVSRALAAGVPVGPLPAELRIVSQPWLHGSAWWPAIDREVRTRRADGTVVARPTQREALVGAMTTAQAERFVERGGPMPAAVGDPVIGRVDMAAYAAWLRREAGFDVGY